MTLVVVHALRPAFARTVSIASMIGIASSSIIDLGWWHRLRGPVTIKVGENGSMARYKATVDSPHSPAEVFAYLSDFSTAQDWDPGTVQSERLGEGPLGETAEFRLVASFLGRRTTLTYRIVEYDPPNAVTFRGENSTVVSLDRITFERSDGGTRVTYDADLTLTGWLKIADPLLGIAFKRIGDQALAGMRKAIGTAQPLPDVRLGR
jgi:carbon monoxide dehydrogenase subunit G